MKVLLQNLRKCQGKSKKKQLKCMHMTQDTVDLQRSNIHWTQGSNKCI